MKFFFKLIGILFVLLITVPVGWWVITSFSDEWAYKMTVVVETPEGIKTGSSVQEFRYYYEPSIIPHQGGLFYHAAGEAVVVDLGERGMLFSLLDDGRAAKEYFYHSRGNVEAQKPAIGTKVVLPESYWPRFVTFEDMNDPKTVRTASYASKVFGEGVSIKSVTIEMTDEDVTTGILEYLPWLETIGGGYLHGGFSSRGAPLGLHGGDFLRIGR